MKREAALRQRLRSLEILGEAVGAMKSLSAHHFREARSAVAAARAYREGVERIAKEARASIPAGSGGSGLLVIGGEFGLCGSYNAELVAAADKRRSELGAGPTLVVGHRAALLLGRRGAAALRVYATPTSSHAITDLLLPLAEDVLSTYAAENLSSFEILSCPFGGVGVHRPVLVRLLPLATPESESTKAARYVAPEDLARAAAREFLYIVLYDLLLDAIASEHSARLSATDAAEKWLGERADRLRQHIAAARREAGTQEVIEIAMGARARG